MTRPSDEARLAAAQAKADYCYLCKGPLKVVFKAAIRGANGGAPDRALCAGCAGGVASEEDWTVPADCGACGRSVRMLIGRKRRCRSMCCGPACREVIDLKHEREQAAQARLARDCEWCHQPFEPKKIDSRFCSRWGRSCENKWYRARVRDHEEKRERELPEEPPDQFCRCGSDWNPDDGAGVRCWKGHRPECARDGCGNPRGYCMDLCHEHGALDRAPTAILVKRAKRAKQKPKPMELAA